MIDADRLPDLTTERLRLRWLTEADVAALFAIFSSPEVARYWSFPAYTEVAQAKELLRDAHASFRSHTLYQWGVATRDGDRIVGTCTLADIDAQNRRAEVGFALGREHWGRGYMKEALPRVIEFAFADLRLHRLEADVDPRNDASLRLLERFGFQREGYLRERWHVADEINDTVFYGLLAREWRSTSD